MYPGFFAFELGRQVANKEGYVCWFCECLEGGGISQFHGCERNWFFKHFFLLHRFTLKSKREKSWVW